MKGIDLRNFLYLNKISQDDAAQLIGVKRQTINNWCLKDELTGKILTKAKETIDFVKKAGYDINDCAALLRKLYFAVKIFL